MVYRTNLGALGKSFQPTVQAMQIPASTGGINSLMSLGSMPAEDCIYTYNLMPSEYGMELRKGWREWAVNIGGAGTPEEVRSMVTYDGVEADHTTDRLFAMTSTGIYNVTLFNTDDPAPVLTWPITGGGKAGFGTFTNFSNDANESFVYFTDTQNGLYRYEASIDTWSAVTGLTVANDLGEQVPWGLEPITLFVTAHKLRLWLTVDDSSDAWYLPIESGAGEVFKFTFGSKFQHGGYLMGLWSWSYETTAGIENFLVAISRSGDVLVYKGSDPTQVDWNLVGQYYVGEVTNSRNIVVNYGADMYVLSAFGVTAMSDLIKGKEVYNSGPSVSAKVAKLLRGIVRDNLDSKEWSLVVDSSNGFLQVVIPYTLGQEQFALQLTQNLLTNAWGFWRGVPILSSATLESEYYIGTKSGQILIYGGVVDGLLLDGTPGAPVEFETLTAFNPGENPSQFKRVGYIRTVGILEGEATVNTAPIYDFRIQASARDPGIVPSSDYSLWDSGVWSQSVWNTSVAGVYVVIGGLGMGRVVAVSIKGSATARIIVTGWDLMYTRGGLL